MQISKLASKLWNKNLIDRWSKRKGASPVAWLCHFSTEIWKVVGTISWAVLIVADVFVGSQCDACSLLQFLILKFRFSTTFKESNFVPQQISPVCKNFTIRLSSSFEHGQRISSYPQHRSLKGFLSWNQFGRTSKSSFRDVDFSCWFHHRFTSNPGIMLETNSWSWS